MNENTEMENPEGFARDLAIIVGDYLDGSATEGDLDLALTALASDYDLGYDETREFFASAVADWEEGS